MNDFKLRFGFFLTIIIMVSCSKPKQNNEFYNKWLEIYTDQRKEFATNKTYKSLEYYRVPLEHIEAKIDSLELNYFNKERDALIRDLHSVLPQEYIQWELKDIDSFFSDVELKDDLAIRCLAFRSLVLQRLSTLHYSSNWELNTVKPIFVKGGSNDNFYGRFIIDASNYIQPPIIILNKDTVPYSEDYFTYYLKSKPDFGDKDTLIADLYLFSWGDTTSFKVKVVD